MQKIDRLGWAAGFTFSSFGVRVGVRTNRPEMLARIREYLPMGAKLAEYRYVDLLYSFRIADPPARKGTRTFHLLYEEFLRIARTEDPNTLLSAFHDNVENLIPQVAPRLLFVHAGVVGWQDRAILVPGRSFSGKSTLIAALVRAGATYYSDEYAVLDGRGLVHPYARPLSLRREAEIAGTPTPVEQIGGKTGRKPLPVGTVLAVKFRKGARWQPRALPPGKGILELLSNTVPARRRPADTLAILKRATEGARFLKGTRSEADEIAGKILKEMSPERDFNV